MRSALYKSLGTAATISTFLVISGCSKAPEAKAQAEDTVKAVAEKVMSYEDIGIPSGKYDIDKTHGYVTFSYSHFGLSNPQLRFRDVDASIDLNAENLEDSNVSVLIKSASIDSGVDVFDEHLNSDGWFNTEAHPEITFKSTSFTRDTQTTGKMTGDLTIMGNTHPVTLDVKLLAAMIHPRAKKPVIGLEGRGTLKRSDFGLGKYAPSVSDEVDLLISAEFFKNE